jgi:DNA-binding response OmpR family regulator
MVKTAMIVEDNHDINDIYTRTLQSAGWQVISFKTVRETLAYLESHPVPPVIILDMGLADGSGENILYWLADHGLDHVKVILASANVYDNRWRATLIRPADVSLQKPVTPRQLLNVMRTI